MPPSGRWVIAGAEELEMARTAQIHLRSAAGGSLFRWGNTSAQPLPPLESRTWEWQQPDCPLRHFDALDFCRFLNRTVNASLLVVGDSTSDLFATTLVTMLGNSSGPVKSVNASRTLQGRKTYRVCRRGRIEFVRNDVLDIKTEYAGPAVFAGRGQRCGDEYKSARQRTDGHVCNAWTDRLMGFDVVVLNTGAHGIEQPGVRERAARRTAANVAASVRPGTHLLFRNTAIGHPNCSSNRLSAPLGSVDLAHAQLSAAPQETRYDWLEYAERNAILEPIFRRAGFRVVDVYNASALRADSHSYTDCLHYLVPGPSLHWVRVFWDELLRSAGRDADQDCGSTTGPRDARGWTGRAAATRMDQVRGYLA